MRDEFQIRYNEKKLQVINLPIEYREVIDVRARGGSKTRDTMELALYLASIGFVGIWFAALSRQMEQPKKYLKQIIERSYLKYLISDLLKESVIFKTGGELRIINLTEDNARSPRSDFVIYDEEARADMDAYNAAVSILSVTELGFSIHISTPCKATVFEENWDRLKLRELRTGEQFCFTRRWDEISFLEKKRPWYEEEQRVRAPWYFRQEHECSFELPMGAVFQLVNYDSYPDWLMQSIKDQPLCSGVDWNPVSGHWLVSGKWTPDFRNFVFMEAHDIGQGYGVEMTNKQWNILLSHMTNGNRLIIESGGINEEYVKWLYQQFPRTGSESIQISEEEWDAQGVEKLNCVNYIIQNGVWIYCDKQKLSILAKMIGDCQWDPDSPVPKLKKDKSDSPHALDAGLHAMSEKNREALTVSVGRLFVR